MHAKFKTTPLCEGLLTPHTVLTLVSKNVCISGDLRSSQRRGQETLADHNCLS